MSELLTAEQVGEKLGLRPSTICALARSGKIPRVKLTGRIIRFDWNDVVAAMKSGQEKPGKSRRARR